MISIPIWFDWERIIDVWKAQLKTISIPIWFDWEQRTDELNITPVTFQFLYGSIERDVQVQDYKVKVLFQFLYGSIESPD